MSNPVHVLTALALGLATALQAQEPPPPDKQPPKWPKLSSSAGRKAKAKARLVGLDTDEETRAEAAAAEDELAGLGAAVAPVVLRRLGDREVEDRPGPVTALGRILDQVCDATYAPLIADRIDDRSVEVRRWSTGWIARQRLPDHRGQLAAALEDDDGTVRFRAGLGLLSLGDGDQLELVLADCQEDWRDKAALVHTILAPACSATAASRLIDRISGASIDERVAGLRLARSLVPESHAAVVATFLDDSAAPVKKEAINALRMIVDGDQPLERLSVFQAIEAAKKWKERLR